MPIYYSRVPPGTDIKKEIIQDLPKIFTSTVLIRAFKAPTGPGTAVMSLEENRHLEESELVAKKILREAPVYSTGAYNN
jgi:hypothetical protein